jgi:ArsR family transcriptional regulator
MKSENVIAALFALAQESRLAVFRLLVKRGPQGYSPGDLAEKLSIPAPTLSFHLKELIRSGLVSSRREGRFLFYSVNFDAMEGVIGFLTEKCCTLADQSCATACAPSTPAKKRSA